MSDYKENEDFIEPNSSPEDQPQQDGGFDENAEIGEDIQTAVLLVMDRSGMVMPITKLDNLKMDRQANAHEVMRMCADAKDQISAIRVVGELAQSFDNINKRSLKEVAKILSSKMDDNLQ